MPFTLVQKSLLRPFHKPGCRNDSLMTEWSVYGHELVLRVQDIFQILRLAIMGQEIIIHRQLLGQFAEWDKTFLVLVTNQLTIMSFILSKDGMFGLRIRNFTLMINFHLVNGMSMDSIPTPESDPPITLTLLGTMGIIAWLTLNLTQYVMYYFIPITDVLFAQISILIPLNGSPFTSLCIYPTAFPFLNFVTVDITSVNFTNAASLSLSSMVTKSLVVMYATSLSSCESSSPSAQFA